MTAVDPRAALAEARNKLNDVWQLFIKPVGHGPEWDREIESLLSRIDAALAGMGWQPIETVSHENDGYLLRARYPGMTNMTDPYFGWWMENEKRWARWPHKFPPTHFMVVPPLPEPPGAEAE